MKSKTSKSKEKKNDRKKKGVDSKKLLSIDQPFNYEDVVTVTGPEYVRNLHRNGIAVLPYEELKKTLQEKEIATEVAEISMVPQNTIDINDEQKAKKILSLMEAFEDHDDVQNTYANFDIPDEIMNRIM